MGRKSSVVYNVNYYFIWCPKYRKPILEEAGIKEFLEDQIHTMAATKECKVLALEVIPDQIHLFISTTPFESPTGLVKVLKGVTALRLFKFPELRNKYWKGKLWSPSYHVGTAEQISAETIQRYRGAERDLTQFIHP